MFSVCDTEHTNGDINMIFTAILIWILTACASVIFSFYLVNRLSKSRKIDVRTISIFNKRILNNITAEHIVTVTGAVIVSALCGYFAFRQIGITVLNIKLLLSFCALLSAFIIDFKTHLIPNILSIILISVRFIFMLTELISGDKNFISMLISSFAALIICFLVLIIISKIMHGGIGYGDIKLISSLGFMCGIYAVMYTLLFGLLLSFLVSIIMIAAKVKKMKDYIPFGPFIFLGYIATLILGAY